MDGWKKQKSKTERENVESNLPVLLFFSIVVVVVIKKLVVLLASPYHSINHSMPMYYLHLYLFLFLFVSKTKKKQNTKKSRRSIRYIYTQEN